MLLLGVTIIDALDSMSGLRNVCFRPKADIAVPLRLLCGTDKVS